MSGREEPGGIAEPEVEVQVRFGVRDLLRLRHPRKKALALVMIAAGGVIVASTAGYLAYRIVATSRLDRYRVIAIKPDAWSSSWPSVPAILEEDGAYAATLIAGGAAAVDRSGGPDRSSDDRRRDNTQPAYVSLETLYPAQVTNPKYWSAPLWAGADPFEGPSWPQGFRLVAVPGMGSNEKGEAPARLVIPAIGLDAPVKPLEIDERDGRVAYETVNQFVGFIPGTAVPGENGAGWYFGHLESPGLGEGNVFYRLPDVAELIKNDPVDVLVTTATGTYLYRVTATEVIPAERLAVTQTRASTITLVASFPRLVYSHRFVVYAELLATRIDAEAVAPQ